MSRGAVSEKMTCQPLYVTTFVDRFVIGQVSQIHTSSVMTGKSAGISGLVLVLSDRTFKASARFQVAVKLSLGL